MDSAAGAGFQRRAESRKVAPSRFRTPLEPPMSLPEALNGIWPIDPDPAVTNLAARQHWRFAEGRLAAVEVAGLTLSADDPRLAFLGLRRGAGGPYPARFRHDPLTGAALAPDAPEPAGDILAVEADSAADLPLPAGVPALFRAGRPAMLCVFQENLGLLEWRAPEGWIPLGRLPPADLPPGAHALAAGPEGFAYATRDALVTVALPQLGAGLGHAALGRPDLRFLAGPARIGDRLAAPGLAAGEPVLAEAPVRAGEGVGPLALAPLPALPGLVAAPVLNRLGDAFWPAEAGFLIRTADGAPPRFLPWPAGFAPILAQSPYRDRSGILHQLGLRAGRYHYAALAPGDLLHGLDGPHCAAGGVSYAAGERFDPPWDAPAEALTLGAYAGSLLVPLLALPRDTLLLALRLESPTAEAIRGLPFPRPLTGYVLHHAHGAGLTRLPASLEVGSLADARACLGGGRLHLYSRRERRGRSFAVRFR